MLCFTCLILKCGIAPCLCVQYVTLTVVCVCRRYALKFYLKTFKYYIALLFFLLFFVTEDAGCVKMESQTHSNITYDPGMFLF